MRRATAFVASPASAEMQCKPRTPPTGFIGAMYEYVAGCKTPDTWIRIAGEQCSDKLECIWKREAEDTPDLWDILKVPQGWREHYVKKGIEEKYVHDRSLKLSSVVTY